MNSLPRAQVKRTLADLVPRYMLNRRKDVDLARTALGLKDFAALKDIGHRLKGSGAGYGFHQITVLGGQLEQASLRTDDVVALQLVEQLDEYLRNVQIDLV
jgi:HPt (histidine-containing phosphotransfer) domain-containing protein